mgnify:CR=1 FL=1
MSINVGDNFRYLGKKFLDDRQSFKTLNELLACSAVPEGFIAYCEENKTRYEFLNNEWQEYKVLTGNGNGGGGESINKEQVIESVLYIGDDEPGDEDDDKLWLDPSSDFSSSPGITLENPLILEMLAAIQTLQNQVKELQERVEYLEINGGGGGSGDLPDYPWDPEEPDVEESYLALEEGGIFLFEDGTYILLEESAVKPDVPSKPSKEEFLALEDGSLILLEDGSYILLEQQPIIEEEEEESVILLENGEKLLLEDGSFIVLEQSTSSSKMKFLLEKNGLVLLESENKILVEKQ